MAGIARPYNENQPYFVEEWPDPSEYGTFDNMSFEVCLNGALFWAEWGGRLDYARFLWWVEVANRAPRP